jgi:hypothetical protein
MDVALEAALRKNAQWRETLRSEISHFDTISTAM